MRPEFPSAAPIKHESEIARFEKIDRRLCAIGSALGGRERRYAALIAREVLERAEYPRAFPHLLMLASPVANAEDVGSGKESVRPRRDTSWCLSPAVCYHVFAELAGQRLAEPLAVTARGQCFRHEAGCVPHVRQLEFAMRELVLIGTRRWVQQMARNATRQVELLAVALGLHGTWREASDPFFLPSAQGKALTQRLTKVKREYCSDERGGLALASVNHHHAFFGERFAITSADGEPVHSACVAVGLDRWFGLFDQTAATATALDSNTEEAMA